MHVFFVPGISRQASYTVRLTDRPPYLPHDRGGAGTDQHRPVLSPDGSQIDPHPCHTTGGGPGLINTVMCFSLDSSQIDPLPCHTTEGGPGLINTVMCSYACFLRARHLVPGTSPFYHECSFSMVAELCSVTITPKESQCVTFLVTATGRELPPGPNPDTKHTIP